MTPSNTPTPFGRITLRSIVLAALLAPVAAWVNVSVEAIRYAGQPTTVSVYPHMMALLLLLVAGSGAAGRIRASWRLSPAEMVTVYFLVFMAAVMSAHDTMEVLVPILTYPFRYANAGNKWESAILPLLPRRLTVSDPSAVEHYWLGGADLWRSGEAGVWLGPALCWAAFLGALVFCGACLNSLLRRQWAENERLAFPLAQLPLDLVQPRQPLWTNRLFLLGFAAAVAHDTWFGLHTLWPTIAEPYIRFQTAQQLLTAPPWNAIAWLPVAFFPWIMGLGVMLPTDLLFSCWFFFIIWKLQPVVAAANGYTDIPGFPFVFEQSFGAYMAIAVFTLYTARKALRRGFSALWTRDVEVTAGDPLHPRTASLGVLAALSAALWFLTKMGMAAWVACGTLFIYLMAAVAITRLRAEMGTPAHDLGQMGPMRLLPLAFGKEAFRDQDLVALALSHGFNRNYRACPMAVHAEGLQAQARSGVSLRGIFWALVAFACWGALCGFAADVALNYRWGAISHCDPPYVSAIFGKEPYDHITNLMQGGITALQRRPAVAAVGVGFAVAAALGAVRMGAVGFPFHPVGYAISSNWCMSLMWLSLLAAWVIKVSLLKAGGLRLYRQALPLFLGIVLGECAAGTAWMALSALLGTKTFIVWPYG
ncbi:MAG: hypothetical protein NT029_14070 [Armatimonadetes bacterium]|nr:hypothetical protein [Armatimonadota bacterium]